MKNDIFSEIRSDCLISSSEQSETRSKLSFRHIAVTGGTGFLGTWIAEMVAALNDDQSLGITLDLYARNITEWMQRYPHLSKRKDIRIISQDVRSPFEFSSGTNYVLHAAGIPNNRVHASDPLRVQQTTISGIHNALDAAAHLDNLIRFVNVSSCLVNGLPNRHGALKESDYFPMPSGQLHTVYLESKRAAENLAAIYRSQFRMPVSTIRPFTFAGPFQELDRPWALNSFMRDVLSGSTVRIHGNGQTRRSYMYGSDAAWWSLAALVNGQDGLTYNLGSPVPVTHIELVKIIGDHVASKPRIELNTMPPRLNQYDDLYPDTIFTQNKLGVSEAIPLNVSIEKTLRWFNKLKFDT